MEAPLIVVADDEALIRWSLKEHLEKAGYRVMEAGTGRGALELFRRIGAEDISLVILDYKLPDLDGLEVLRAAEEVLACPVIMMSAYGTSETAAEAEKLGVFRFLHKPFDYGEVVSLVGQALAGPQTH